MMFPLVVPWTKMSSAPFRSGDVPVAFDPNLFPQTRSWLIPSICIPCAAFPEIRFPSPAASPPTIAPVAEERSSIPTLPFASAAVPAAFVPM